MYDIKPLEEEWKQYQKNKKKPFIIWTIAFLLVCFLVVLLVKYKHLNFPQFLPDNSMHKLDKYVSDKDTNVLINKEISVLEVREKKNIMKIKPPVKLSVESTDTSAMPTLPVVNDIPVFDESPVKSKIIVSNAPQVKRVKKDIPRKKMHLNIIKSSTVSAYKDVESRFYQSHDTDDSLFLAKSYYRKGNYKKSEYWSLQTNKINSNIEESWMIFVKSKIKLGDKNQAIRILTNYAKKSNSSAAWNLLLKLKK